ncbi:very short patch repair endonuclease [Streptomyces tanashiensis]|uniref:very short patch repair endonuclease n=1 Tax=Streptomyces tanashiensis TaxID=67367 RepID=UPI0036A34BEC
MTGDSVPELPADSWASSLGNRRSMQSNKGRDTKPEMALRSAAHALGLRYHVSERPIPAIRRTADLVFTRARIAVFLDGCFWHVCPEHFTVSRTNPEYWAEKAEKNQARDRQTDRLLEEAGWAVLRVWEHEDPRRAAVRLKELYDRRISTQRDGMHADRQQNRRISATDRSLPHQL